MPKPYFVQCFDVVFVSINGNTDWFLKRILLRIDWHNPHPFISTYVLPLRFNLFGYLVLFERTCRESDNHCLISVKEVEGRRK